MMFKRLITIGVVLVVMGVLGSVAHAGWGGCCGFAWKGSINFRWLLQGGYQPDGTEVLSTVHIDEVAVTCRNRGGKLATAWAPRDVVFMTSVELEGGEVDENGQIEVFGSFDETDDLDDPNSLCPNAKNWTAIDVTPTLFEWDLAVQTTNKSGTKEWDRESYLCTYDGPFPAIPSEDPDEASPFNCVLQEPM